MSTSSVVHERCYRGLVLLFPRRFRRVYGSEMVQVFRDDLHERGPVRTWSRALSDLVFSVPVQHVEAAMSQRSTSRAAQAGLAAAGLAVLAVLATGRYVVIAVPITAIIAVTSLLYWRSRLPYREAVSDASASWWAVLCAGAALLAGIGLTAAFGPDMDWFPWTLAVFLYLSGWALIITGVVLGLLRLVRRFRHQPAF